jgi:hypothetical protein
MRRGASQDPILAGLGLVEAAMMPLRTETDHDD